MNKLKGISFILVILFCFNQSFGQASCLEKMQTNEELFKAGDFTSSLANTELLLNEKACKFSIVDKENALVLVIRNLIELDRLSELDPWYKKLFENNKYFQAKEELLEEDFILHLSNHGTRPVLDVGFSIGARLAFVNRIRSYSVYEQLNYAESSYESAPKPSLGFSVGFMPWQHHRFSLGMSLDQLEYTREFGGYASDYQYKFGEDVKAAGVSFHYGYQFNMNDQLDITPIIGYTGNYLYKIENGLEIQYPSGGSGYYYLNNQIIHNSINQVSKSEIERPDARIDFVHFLSAGVELSYRIKRFHFFLNNQFQVSLQNIVVPEERYANHELVYQYNYVDEDFSLSTLSIVVGLRYNLTYKVW